LQNIPIRSEEGRKIRQAFIAPPGFKILSADYSQVELRIMAHLSQDPGLKNAFAQGIDVHKATAAEVFGVPVNQVSHEQRRRAKAINFGLIYGMSSYGLAKQLGINRDEAERYIQIYFSRYPNVQEYMESARRLALKQGYVETLFGRRVHVADIRAAQQQRRLAAERQAINAPLQGTAADIIKFAMIAIDRCILEKNLPLTMIMQVHDELVFEAAIDHLPTLTQEIRHCMETVAQLSIPLLVDIGVGDNWDEGH
jgi:DNA polymerase-1